MGRRLDGFDVELAFDAEGKVSKTEYSDGDGCGARREFDPYATTVWEMVQYHLKHYKTSHKMEPARMCTFSMPHPTVSEILFECNREPHIGDEHELVAKRNR